MAQILKFSTGGVSKKLNWGTFTIDNTEYQMTDENIQKLYNHAKTLDADDRYQFDFIIKALESGENLRYANNTLYGNVSFDVSKEQEKKMSKKIAHGIGKGADARRAISSLDNLSLSNPEEDKRTLKFNNRVIEYARDDKGDFILENGNKKYISGANNQNVISLLENIRAYSLSPEEFEITGLGDNTSEYIRNWYNAYGNENFENLITRIKTGNLNESDVELLNDLNITIGQELTEDQKKGKKNYEDELAKQKLEQETENKLTEVDKIYSDYGFSTSNPYIIYNDQTKSFQFANQELANQIYSLGSAIWLNNDFISDNPSFAPILKGHENGIFVINGEIYDANDKRLLNNSVFKKFAEYNRNNPDSNKYIKQKWTSSPDDWRLLNEFNNNKYYSGYDDRLVKDISGNYILTPWGDYGMNYLFQRLPKETTDEMFDIYGRLKPEYYDYWSLDDTGIHKMSGLKGFDNYLKSLQQQPEVIRNKYYSSIPEYLKEMITGKNGKKIVKLGNDLYQLEDGNFVQKLPVDNKEKYYFISSTEKFPETFDKNFIKTHEEVNMSNYFKQGGKIVKALNGYKTRYDHLADIQKTKLYPSYNFKLNYPTDPEILKLKLKFIGIDPDKNNLDVINLTDELNKANKIKIAKETNTYPVLEYSNSSNNIETDADSKAQKGFKDIKMPEVSMSNLIGLGRFISSLHSANVDFKNTEKYIKKMRGNIEAMQAPQKQYVNITEPIENRILDSQISDLLNKKYAYSDPNMVEAYKNSSNTQIGKMQLQKAANWTNTVNTVKNINKQIDDENYAQRVSLNNQKLNMDNQFNQALLNAEAAKNKTIFQSIENIGLELQSRFKEFEDLRHQAILAKENINDKADLNSNMVEEFKKSGGRDALSDSMKDVYDRMGFLPAMLQEINPTAYNKLMSNYQTNYLIKQANNPSDPLFRFYKDIPMVKQGAKLSKLTNQIAINQNKSTNKIIEKLNKDIVKLFIKMMK